MKELFRILFLGCMLFALTDSFSQIVPPPTKEGLERDTLSVTSPDITPTCRQIIGYYPSWQWYDRGQLLAPENIDYTRYTVLNYSFYQTDTLGNIFGTDEWADSVLLRGKYDWSSAVQPAYIQNTSLVDYSHAWGVKLMVSIGGWTLSENFPKVAKDPARRAAFASNCVKLLKDYQFDGIDIDWEYPGYADHKSGPEDKENFTLLMKSIRDSIDSYGKKIKYKFLLTAAFGANKSQMDYIEYDKLVNVMDYFNMMCYDYNGTWSEDANHNSPLYAPGSGSPASMDVAFKLLVNTYKVPAEKINLGVGFYGRSLKFKDTRPALYAKNEIQKTDDRTFVEDEGSPQYYNILLKKDKGGFVEKWDSIAQVPYMISEEKKTFLSYDNPRSIRLKAEYIVKHEAAGVIIWEITGDYIEKRTGTGKISGTPLADELIDVLQPCRRRTIKKRWRN